MANVDSMTSSGFRWAWRPIPLFHQRIWVDNVQKRRIYSPRRAKIHSELHKPRLKWYRYPTVRIMAPPRIICGIIDKPILEKRYQWPTMTNSFLYEVSVSVWMLHCVIITGPPSGLVLLCTPTSVVVVVVCNAADVRPAGRRTRGLSARRRPVAWAADTARGPVR